MKFRRTNGGTIELGDAALSIMLKYKQIAKESKEAGGILLGRSIKDSIDVLIDEASEPAKEDLRRRFFFFRKKEPAQALVNKTWQYSQSVSNYLGEWHTHPEAHPTPSKLDLTNWVNLSRQTQCEQDFLVFSIVGIETIRFWELDRLNASISLLECL